MFTGGSRPPGSRLRCSPVTRPVPRRDVYRIFIDVNAAYIDIVNLATLNSTGEGRSRQVEASRRGERSGLREGHAGWIRLRITRCVIASPAHARSSLWGDRYSQRAPAVPGVYAASTIDLIAAAYQRRVFANHGHNPSVLQPVGGT